MEYSRNFQDNIRASEFNKSAQGIANWIEENRPVYEWAKEPNAYEMTNVFLFAGKYITEGYNIDLDNVKRIWDLRLPDFERCGIQSNNFVYQICEQSYNAASSGRALVSDEESHSALRKMAGVGLYLMQQQREQKMDYNNVDELIALIEDSKALKQKHPQLHSTLKFDNNIAVLYRLQQLHLDEQSKAELDEVYNEYINFETQSNRNVDGEEQR